MASLYYYYQNPFRFFFHTKIRMNYHVVDCNQLSPVVHALTVQLRDADSDGDSDITLVPLCPQQSISFFALNFHEKFFPRCLM